MKRDDDEELSFDEGGDYSEETPKKGKGKAEKKSGKKDKPAGKGGKEKPVKKTQWLDEPSNPHGYFESYLDEMAEAVKEDNIDLLRTDYKMLAKESDSFVLYVTKKLLNALHK